MSTDEQLADQSSAQSNNTEEEMPTQPHQDGSHHNGAEGLVQGTEQFDDGPNSTQQFETQEVTSTPEAEEGFQSTYDNADSTGKEQTEPAAETNADIPSRPGSVEGVSVNMDAIVNAAAKGIIEAEEAAQVAESTQITTSDQGQMSHHQITGLPPGISLIQADQGQEGEGAIFLLVTGPVDGESGTANAIAVDAATAAAMASLQQPIEGVQVSGAHVIPVEEVAAAVTAGSKGASISDPVAEILSSITSTHTSVSISDEAVAQVAASVEAQSSSGSKIPSASEVSLAQDILALASSALSGSSGTNSGNSNTASNNITVNANTENSALQSVSVPDTTNLDGKPLYTALLRDCVLIGDCYYGYVLNEMEMDQVLNAYKKETNTLFAIRQTPSPVKEDNGTVRLMWKSQHVPYDGIPFINIGRRATVMECEHGPRKKTNALKRMLSNSQDKEALKNIVNLTCPARLFVKKVRKFPEYQVDPNTDPKILRTQQEQALKQLRTSGMETQGEVRLYMQLPLASAHRYHNLGASTPDSETAPSQYKTNVAPKVVDKVREVVRQGVASPFVVRQIARNYVERELFNAAEEKPPKHDRSYYPTMIEIQNLTQQVQAELASGLLTPLPPSIEQSQTVTKAKKRRASVKTASGEPSAKRAAKPDDDAKMKPVPSASASDAASTQTEITTLPATLSLELSEGQLENFSVSNLTMEQLQQLAKIGLLALNNAAFSKQSVNVSTSSTSEAVFHHQSGVKVDMGSPPGMRGHRLRKVHAQRRSRIRTKAKDVADTQTDSQPESTSAEASSPLQEETVVLLASALSEQVTSSDAVESEPPEQLPSMVYGDSKIERPSMTIDETVSSGIPEQATTSNLIENTDDPQPSTTSVELNENDAGELDSREAIDALQSLVTSEEASTTTESTEEPMQSIE